MQLGVPPLFMPAAGTSASARALRTRPYLCWVLALFGPNFGLLLASDLRCFAAFHMAELRLARLFQFGLGLF
jgi:hypothetical protein